MLTRARGVAALAALLFRAARMKVEPRTLDQRLRDLPLRSAPVRAPVDIRWNAHAVPFITAETVSDLAVGLGVVHAHLRLAQMEILRRVAQGRICELIGGLGLDLDIALRTIDLPRAVPGMIAMLPPETRQWVESFLDGVNHVIAHAPAAPVECRLFGLTRTPWTIEDLFALARLTSADITWVLALPLLKMRETMRADEWAALWPGLLGVPPTAFGDPFAAVLSPAARGSNSAAVDGRRTQSGAAMLASDPHVQLQLPPVWLACGMAAPGIRTSGLMLPGAPWVAIGRNETIAWGATNLHAAASVFVDLAKEADPQITERHVDISIRNGGTKRVAIRESRFGPVISDAKLFGLKRPVALSWVGHRPSDEWSAMLRVNRATDFDEFRRAFEGFAVQGYSFTYADRRGRVGILRAGHVPRRTAMPPDLTEFASVFDDIVSLASQTAIFDPPEGFVVSANEDPRSAIVSGFFFAPADRALRQAGLLDRAGITLDDILAMQRDVAAPGTRVLRDAILARAEALGIRLPPEILAWDGRYDEASRGALGYEVLLTESARTALGGKRLAPLMISLANRELIGARLLGLPDAVLRPALVRAAGRARRAMARTGSWGEAHRLTLAHPLARLPGIGRKFGRVAFGMPGSNDTLYKTAHDPVPAGRRRGLHPVTFGSSARYVADLGTPDNNLLVILGGQDGWTGSANAMDQVDLWRAERFMPMPLGAAAVAAQFTRHTRLVPGGHEGPGQDRASFV